jgi:hypothetical protein
MQVKAAEKYRDTSSDSEDISARALFVEGTVHES